MKLKDMKILAADMRKVVDRNKSCYINIPRRFARLLKVKPGDYILWMLEPNGKTIRIKKCSFDESVLGEDSIQLLAYINGEEDHIAYGLNQTELALALLEDDTNIDAGVILNMEFPTTFKEEKEDVS